MKETNIFNNNQKIKSIDLLKREIQNLVQLNNKFMTKFNHFNLGNPWMITKIADGKINNPINKLSPLLKTKVDNEMNKSASWTPSFVNELLSIINNIEPLCKNTKYWAEIETHILSIKKMASLNDLISSFPYSFYRQIRSLINVLRNSFKLKKFIQDLYMLIMKIAFIFLMMSTNHYLISKIIKKFNIT